MIRMVNTKLELDTHASHCCHMVTNMKFKHGITLLCYTAITLPAHVRWIDTSTPNLPWRTNSTKIYAMISSIKSVIPHIYIHTHTQTHEGHSEINASYFIMVAHNVRGECWWYGSRGWTFPPIFPYILLPCDRWHQRGNLTKRRLIWKCVWSKGV